ncbi:MAG: magnesium transporter [SAR202 cluster bacterium]|nr:magnesium transporter [SAR202 cluster bacterium]
MTTTDATLPTAARLQTAAEHLSTVVPVAAPSDTAGALLLALRARTYDSAADIAVCEQGRLVGMLRIEDLLASSDGAPVSELMDGDPPAVAPGLDQEQVAWKAVRHGERSLAVTDAGGRFLGLVPPQRLLSVLLEEHTEDLARVGGYMRGTVRARVAAEEPVFRRFLHRMPWLLIGLAGALAAAAIVGSFEAALEAHVMLAFFIPGIVYLADAVGTQTETLVIRGMAAQVNFRQMRRREVLTGMLVGVALAAAFFPISLGVWRNLDLSVAVSLSLLAACSVATVVAMTLPWLLDRLGRDPAFGSGPLATVIQDLLSIVIYFSIAIAFVR